MKKLANLFVGEVAEFTSEVVGPPLRLLARTVRAVIGSTARDTQIQS